MPDDKLIHFEALHAKFRDQDSASPQGQIKWLLKQGIPANVVDEAMISVYEEIRGGKTFVSGFEFDQYLLSVARGMQKKELDDHIIKLENFYKGMREKWDKELAAEQPVKKPWYKRILG
jgi:hypothetical protein